MRSIKDLVDMTSGAYMRGSYGKRRWFREIRWLRDFIGLDDETIVGVMYSKYPRWAEETMRLESMYVRWPHMFTPEALSEFRDWAVEQGMDNFPINPFE